MTGDQSIQRTDRGSAHQPLVALVTQNANDLAGGPFEVLLEQARQHGWRLLDVGLTGGSLAGEPAPIGALITSLPRDPVVEQLHQMGCPIVRMGRLEHPDDPAVPAVLPDLPQAGRMAADHFAQRGFRDLALFGHEAMSALPPIEAGFRRRAQTLGCSCQRFLGTQRTGPGGQHDRRDAAVAAWLEALPKPVGLLAANAHYAGRLSIVCRRAGLAVPEDVAVLAMGDQPAICELAGVPISGIDTDPRNMMRIAIQRLIERLEGRTIPSRTFVAPSRIVTRRSTDILAVEHPLVARAIRFIWDRLDREVSVDDVAEAMRLPRYKLERLFREHYGRGVHAELRRVRLERFAELLRTTDLPVRELAPRVGFKSPKFLHDSFCKQHGTTPRRYRLKARTAHARPEPDPAN